MANRDSGHRPGGGIHSKNVVQQPVRTGTGSRGTRPGGVQMLGTMQGDHVTTSGGSATGYRGERLHARNARRDKPWFTTPARARHSHE